jgi:hypothetical protein
MIAADMEEEPVRKFNLSTATGDDRGTITATRADAVKAANTVTERTGVKVYVEPAGTTVATTDGKTRS